MRWCWPGAAAAAARRGLRRMRRFGPAPGSSPSHALPMPSPRTQRASMRSCCERRRMQRTSAACWRTRASTRSASGRASGSGRKPAPSWPPACGSGRNVVLDADALTSFADGPEALFDVLHEGCVLTPHAGEFARLFGELPTGDEAPERAAAVAAAARRSGAVVLLKGALTLVAAPDGTLLAADATGPAAAPWLATAGSGDVLAGMVCGLLARGIEPPMAGAVAAWLHAECARSFGPGLIAEESRRRLTGRLQRPRPLKGGAAVRWARRWQAPRPLRRTRAADRNAV